MFTKCPDCSAIFFGSYDMCNNCGAALNPVYLDYNVEMLLFSIMATYGNTNLDRFMKVLKQREDYDASRSRDNDVLWGCALAWVRRVNSSGVQLKQKVWELLTEENRD